MKSARVAAAAVLATAWSFATGARAEDQCITAYEQTQSLRKDGKIKEAKEQAIVCAADACPKALSRDCARWIAELDASIPSVVFDIRTVDGAELVNVRVTMDGKPLVEKAEGRAVPIEIGAHKFRFEPTGSQGLVPGETSVVIHEGEKNRKISVVLRHSQASERPVPFMTYVFGSVAVIALGGAAYFGIKGLTQKSDLDKCKPSCPAADVNAMTQSFAIADIALGVGIVSAVATAYVYFSRPAVDATPPAQSSLRPSFGLAPLRSGAAATLSASF